MTTVPVEVKRGPGRPRSVDRDEAIVAAAIDELIANGYSGLSIEAVAARAGVAKTTIYRRWAGKDELVLAARPDIYRRFRDQVVGPRQQVTFDVLRRGAERGEIRSDFDPAWVNDMLVSPIVAAVLTHRPRLTKAQAAFCVDVVMSWLEVRN